MKNERGIAILFAVFCVVIITYIVTELTYETNVEYLVHSTATSRLKAYYAARAGIELGLLRLKFYQKAKAQFGKQLGSQSSILNMIWSFPVNWPPVFPPEMAEADKSIIGDKTKDSLMSAAYTVTITDEGSKIDLNDLGSKSKTIQTLTKNLLIGVIENKVKDDPKWGEDNLKIKSEELVNNMIDWIDHDEKGLNGGTERTQYPNIKISLFPPNRFFRSVEELRIVAGMNDALFKLLSPLLTVFGAKGINPNFATAEIFSAMDPTITPEIAAAIITRRSDDNLGGNFKSADEFWAFVNEKGGRVSADTQKQLPLIFSDVNQFRVQSVGTFGTVSRKIEVVVYDPNQAAAAVAKQVKADTPPLRVQRHRPQRRHRMARPRPKVRHRLRPFPKDGQTLYIGPRTSHRAYTAGIKQYEKSWD